MMKKQSQITPSSRWILAAALLTALYASAVAQTGQRSTRTPANARVRSRQELYFQGVTLFAQKFIDWVSNDGAQGGAR